MLHISGIGMVWDLSWKLQKMEDSESCFQNSRKDIFQSRIPYSAKPSIKTEGRIFADIQVFTNASPLFRCSENYWVCVPQNETANQKRGERQLNVGRANTGQQQRESSGRWEDNFQYCSQSRSKEHPLRFEKDGNLQKEWPREIPWGTSLVQ